MDSEVFTEWFDIFIKMVKDRPLLLLFDGNMTYITLPVIEEAMKEKVIIVKFPTHVADVLQPLDVTCFGPLKRRSNNCYKRELICSQQNRSFQKEIF